MAVRVPRFLALAALVALATSGLSPVQGEEGVSVGIRIEGATETYSDGTAVVRDCVLTDTSGTTHAKTGVAACALAAAAAQAGFSLEFQDFGFGLFLKRVGADDTPADFSQSWVFWVNDDPASVGLDAHAVATGDRILLAFGAFPGVPLRVTVPENAAVAVPATFVVEKRVGEFDDTFAWHGRWEPAEGATLTIGETAHTVPADGRVTTSFAAEGTVPVHATGPTFIRSAQRTITVGAPVATPTPAPSPTPSPTPTPSVPPTPAPSPTTAPTPDISAAERASAARAALSYLRGHQSDTGEIDGSITTAWSTIAFGTDGQRAGDIRASGSSLLGALARAPLSSATDVERQILAARASGANVRAFAGLDLVAELRRRFDGQQLGNASLVNDDIFGVLALLAAGESANSAPVAATVGTILERQGGDGSWENLDLTAAAIQALRAYGEGGGQRNVDDALARARLNLRQHQDQHGGFGENSATTSWGIQAIVALGEDPLAWRTADGRTPWTALLRYRNASGGFRWKTGTDVSPFMTAYTVPALLGDPWPITVLSVEETPKLVTPTPSPPGPRRSPRVVTATKKPPAASPVFVRDNLQQRSAEEPFATEENTRGSVLGETRKAPSSPTLPPTDHPTDFTPVTPADRRFALTAFGATNIGIGVALGRVVRAIRRRRDAV